MKKKEINYLLNFIYLYLFILLNKRIKNNKYNINLIILFLKIFVNNYLK